MTYLRRAGSKASMLVAAAVLFASVTILLAAATSASATYRQFCWGVYMPGGAVGAHPNICDSLNHDGIAGYTTEVGGSGTKRSVCAQMWWGDGTIMCSGGPNQGVYNTTPAGKFQSVGQILNNAPGDNVVHGYMITCSGPCP